MQPRRYGFFALERVRRDVVTFPDGRTSIHAPGEGAAEAAAYNQDARSDQERDLGEELERWEDRRARWMAAITIDEIGLPTPEPGTRRTYIRDVQRVTFPDGTVDDFDRGKAAEALEARFQKSDPKPVGSTARLAAVEERLTWTAEAFLPDGQRRFDLAPLQWSYGFPLDEVARALNSLAEHGWEVIHVSEDRGLYTGDVVGADAYVTRARYMLATEHG